MQTNYDGGMGTGTNVRLNERAYRLLLKVASDEGRTLGGQICWLIDRECERRGIDLGKKPLKSRAKEYAR